MKFHSNDHHKKVKVTIECSPNERGEGIECENLDNFWEQMGVKIIAKEFEEAAKDSERNREIRKWDTLTGDGLDE